MYRLNVCLLSGIFEKRFGLVNFSEDYYNLLNSFRKLESSVNRIHRDFTTVDEYTEHYDWVKNYRTFRKLNHFFDDFNFFINLQLSPKITQERYSKFSSVDDGFQAFIRRVESMKISQHIKDTIASFLKMQRAKASLVATRENSWLISDKPKLYITDTQLENLGAALNKEAKIGEDGLNQFDRTRAELLQQLATTFQKLPYIRLGQLISNSLPEGTDLFYVTDDKLIQLLRDFELQQ